MIKFKKKGYPGTYSLTFESEKVQSDRTIPFTLVNRIIDVILLNDITQTIEVLNKYLYF